LGKNPGLGGGGAPPPRHPYQNWAQNLPLNPSILGINLGLGN
jgi:hypothetical protein